MRYLRLLALTLLVALAALPLAASAQDQKIDWNLQDNNFIDVQDLGFRFYYPTGWVTDLKSGNGITLADTQASLDAQIDNDDSTVPEGLVATIRGLPLSALTDLGENPTLDSIVDFAVKAAGVTEKDRVEFPILSRRSISVSGTNSDGRYGIASFWVQDGNVVFISLGTPDEKTFNDLGYTWGVTLAAMKPLGAQDLGDAVLTDEASHFTINYPDGWSQNPDQPAAVYELADDLGQGFDKIKGSVFTYSDAALTDINLKKDATLAEALDQIKGLFDLDNSATREEFVVLGQPAITLRGEPTADSKGAGRGLIVTTTLISERVVILILVAPSKDAADALMPTWISMLNSMKSTDAPK